MPFDYEPLMAALADVVHPIMRFHPEADAAPFYVDAFGVYRDV
jgi:hypothetical protein